MMSLEFPNAHWDRFRRDGVCRGATQVVFNGWGLPDKAGTVVVAVDSEQRTITLNAQTGQVSIQ
jgi:hypothetical protein